MTKQLPNIENVNSICSENSFSKAKLTLGVFLALSLLLSVIGYFSFNSIIRFKIEEEFETLSGGKYNLKIDHLHANFFTESVALQGVSITPKKIISYDLSSQSTNEDQIFKLKLDYAYLELQDARHFLTTDSLKISAFIFEHADFEMWNYKPWINKTDFREQIKKLLSKITPALSVKDFSLVNASLRYHGRSKKENPYTHQIERLNVDFHDILIDRDFEKSQVFFSQKFTILAEEYSYRDNDHFLGLEYTQVKGGDESIEVHHLNYNRPGKTRLEIPQITVIRPQVAKYIFENRLEIDSLLIHKTNLEILEVPFKKSTTETLKESLTTILKGFTSEFRSRSIDISQAHFKIERVNQNSKSLATIEFENVSLEISNTFIITKEALQNQRVLFSDEVKFSFDKLLLHNSQNGAVLTLSNFETVVGQEHQTIQNIYFDIPKKANLQISSLEVVDMNWKSLWDERMVILDRIYVDEPRLMLTTFVKDEDEKSIEEILQNLVIRSLPYEIDVNQILIREGQFKHVVEGDSKNGIRFQEAKGIEVKIEDIQLAKDEDIDNPLVKLFEDIEVFSFRDYSLIPKSEAFVLKVARGSIYPTLGKLSLLGLGLNIKSESELSVSALEIYGIDWVKYLRDQNLGIKKILVSDPILVSRLTSSSPGTKFNLKELVPKIFRAASKEVVIDTVFLENGTVDLFSAAQNSFHHHCDSLYISMSNFHIGNFVSQRFMFSNQFDLSFKNFKSKSDFLGSNIAIEKTTISTKKVSSINMDYLTVITTRGDSIHLPDIKLNNFNWDDFWIKDSIQLGEWLISDGYLDLKVRRQDAQKKSASLRLPSYFQGINFNKVSFINSKLSLEDEKGNIHFTPLASIHFHDLVIDKDFFSQHHVRWNTFNFCFNRYTLLSSTNDLECSASLIVGDSRSGDVIMSDVLVTSPELKLSSSKFMAKKFNFDLFINTGKFISKDIIVGNSDLHYQYVPPLNQSTKNSSSWKKFLVTDLIECSVDLLTIKNMSLEVEMPEGVHRLSDLTLELDEVNTERRNKIREDRILFSKQFSVDFSDYAYFNHDELTQFEIGRFQASSQDSSFFMRGVSLKPILAKHDFLNSIRHRKTFLTFKAKEISTNSFHFLDWVNERKLLADHLFVTAPELVVAENLKKNRQKGVFPLMPNDLVRALPFYTKIDRMNFTNGEVIYHERSKKFEGMGTIYFTEVEAEVVNFTNDPLLMTRINPASLTASSKFMDEGELTVTVSMPLLENRWSCTYGGILGEMDASTINEMLVPNANFGLRKGLVRSLSFNASVEKGVANGEMLARYRSFKFDMYKEDQEKRTIFGSYLSSLLISRNNKKKKGIIYYPSSPYDSFVKVLWAGLRSGLKDTLLPAFIINKK